MAACFKTSLPFLLSDLVQICNLSVLWSYICQMSITISQGCLKDPGVHVRMTEAFAFIPPSQVRCTCPSPLGHRILHGPHGDTWETTAGWAQRGVC